MRYPQAPNKRSIMLVLTAAVVGGAAPDSTSSTEHLFLAENQRSMAKMMNAMDAPASGNVDRDFVAAMVPHHQGAVDMAVAELRYGRNEQLRRIAQEIVVEQGQEIAAMRLAIGAPGSPETPTIDKGHDATRPNVDTVPSMRMQQGR